LKPDKVSWKPPEGMAQDLLMDYGRHGGYETMAHGGTGPVIQEPVDTGNPHLDKAITKFYNCLSHTQGPVQKADHMVST